MYVRSVCRGFAALVITSLFALPAAATEQTLGTVTVQQNLGAIVHEVTSSNITVTVSPAPASDVTLNIALSGTVGSEATILPANTLTFSAGQTSKTFQLQAGFNIGTIILNYSLSGTNAGDYTLTPATQTVPVLGRLNLTPQLPQNTTLIEGQSRTYTMTPSRPVLSDLTVTLVPSGTAGFTVTPTVLTFPAGQVSQQFTIQTTSAGTVSVSNTRSGSDASRFGPAGPITITVLAANTPVGSPVVVEFPASASLAVPLSITFAQVTTAGQTTAGTPVSVPDAPSGFKVPGTAINFSFSSTAVIVPPTKVCATYPNGLGGDETALRMFRRTGVSSWMDITSMVDPGSNLLCGSFTGLNGQFAIFTLNAAPVVGTISGPSLLAPGTAGEFSATFTDEDATDTHAGVWIWDDGTFSSAVITNEGGVLTATGQHAYSTAGARHVALIISDHGQQTRSADFEVQVDGAPPVIESVTATPGNIWPPNSKLHDVALTVSATDDSGAPVCTITGVAMPGITAEDYVITGALTLKLKAFPHRSYDITVTCTDAAGRTATKAVTVSVERQ